jgi:hypothetical protein
MYYLPNPKDPIPNPSPHGEGRPAAQGDCSSQCGGILPLQGELEGVYDRSYTTEVEGK